MKRVLSFIVGSLIATHSYAWGLMSGKVEVFTVNTYGNFSDGYLNGGFCFKLVGSNYYLKVPFADAGEKRNNLQLVQSMVLTAYTTGKQLSATYVDWGDDASCRVNGAPQPAKWLENLQFVNG